MPTCVILQISLNYSSKKACPGLRPPNTGMQQTCIEIQKLDFCTIQCCQACSLHCKKVLSSFSKASYSSIVLTSPFFSEIQGIFPTIITFSLHIYFSCDIISLQDLMFNFCLINSPNLLLGVSLSEGCTSISNITADF